MLLSLATTPHGDVLGICVIDNQMFYVLSHLHFSEYSDRNSKSYYYESLKQN